MRWFEEIRITESDNICSPCWTEQRHEVDAVVAFVSHDTVTKHIEFTNYCGHHAEILHLEQVEVVQ